jgi:hypothetical protein
MELHEIDQLTYANEVGLILDKFKKTFDPQVIVQILEDTYCHTGFTQMVWRDILENHKSMAREQEYLLPGLLMRVM